MSEVDLMILNEGAKCTLYTIQFMSEDESEYQRFCNKFKDDAKLNPDLLNILKIVDSITERGALERLFRPEGKMNDSVVALPLLTSKLRLYCLRISDGILVLGNGGIKNSRTYQEDDSLRGYVMDLQKLDALLKEGQRKGEITVTERKIETDKTFDI